MKVMSFERGGKETVDPITGNDFKNPSNGRRLSEEKFEVWYLAYSFS